MNDPIGNAQIASRRNHVDMVGLNASLAGHFGDGHFAFLGKQFRQMAVVLRIEVLNQHECHAGIARQVAEQLRECLQSASGGAYTDNGGAPAFRAFLFGRYCYCHRGTGRIRSTIDGLLCHSPPSPFTPQRKTEHPEGHSFKQTLRAAPFRRWRAASRLNCSAISRPGRPPADP